MTEANDRPIRATGRLKASRRVGVGRLVHALLAFGLPALAVSGGLALLAVAGLTFTRASVENEIYEQRIRALTAEFTILRDQYNDAVRQTTVTELVVEGGSLSVAVRDGLGERAVIETPYDPSREVYVDFAVVGGRVWIRRVFDDATPPSLATVIDPTYAEIDWDSAEAQVGKAVYRSLSEGRWVISVTGNGGLGLRPARPDELVTLSEAPRVTSFDEIEAEAEEAAADVTLRDVLDRLMR